MNYYHVSTMRPIIDELNCKANSLACHGAQDSAMDMYRKAALILIETDDHQIGLEDCDGTNLLITPELRGRAASLVRIIESDNSTVRQLSVGGRRTSQSGENVIDTTSSNASTCLGLAHETQALTVPLEIPSFAQQPKFKEVKQSVQCKCFIGVVLHNMGLLKLQSKRYEAACQMYEMARNHFDLLVRKPPHSPSSSAFSGGRHSHENNACGQYFLNHQQPRIALLFLAVLNNLLHIYQKLGRIQDAQRRIFEALQLSDMIFSRSSAIQDSDDIAMASELSFITLINKGRLHLSLVGDDSTSQQHADCAHESFREALRYSEASSVQLQLVVHSLHSLGQYYLNCGRVSQAVKVYSRGLWVRPRLLAPSGNNQQGNSGITQETSFIFFIMMYRIASVHYSFGNNDETLRSVKVALQLLAEASGKESQCSCACQEGEQSKSAESETAGGAPQSIRTYPHEDYLANSLCCDVATGLQNIAVVQFHLGNGADALQCLDLALIRRRKMYGRNHVAIAETMYIVGRIHHQQKDFENAMKAYGETLRIELLKLGKYHPDVAITMYKIGQCHRSMGKPSMALVAYQKVVKILVRPTSFLHEESSSRGGNSLLLNTADQMESTAHVLQEIGDIHFEGEDPNDAAEAFLESSRLFWEAAQLRYHSVERGTDQSQRPNRDPEVSKYAISDDCDVDKLLVNHGAAAA